jgi:hypothetical protein
MRMPSYRVLWNYRSRPNKEKRYKIHIEIYLGRHLRREYEEIEIPMKVSKEEWSGKQNNWVKINNPYSLEINEAIKIKLDVLYSLNKRYFTSGKRLTLPLIKKELQRNYNPNSFLGYFREIIKDAPETLDGATITRYQVALGHLERWRPDIAFQDLSEELFQEFKKYLEQKKELANSTINGYFNALKKVVEWVRKDQHITKEHQETVFEDIHIKVGKTKKDSLEVHEIAQWKNYDFKGKYAAIERDRDLFLIQIYGGYYYNDLRELLKSELKTDPEYGPYLKSDRYKNDHLALVPLWKFKNAWPLIQKYLDRDPKSPYLFRRDLFTTDAPFNRSLKRIAQDHLKWTRNVFNKLARNTNSQLFIRFGATRPIVAKMLAQEKEESASHYFEVNIAEVIEGTKNIDFDKFDI